MLLLSSLFFSISIFLPIYFVYQNTLAFWHKLNYSLLCQTFQIIYAEIFIKSKVQLLGFELQTFHDINL